jgi:hypothetical protein
MNFEHFIIQDDSSGVLLAIKRRISMFYVVSRSCSTRTTSFSVSDSRIEKRINYILNSLYLYATHISQC